MSDAAPRDPLLLLVAYADGELDADANALVEARLADSAALRNHLDDVRSLQAGLRAHLPAAPSELEWSRRRDLLAAAAPWTVRRGWWSWTVVRRVAAACLVLGLIGGFLLPNLQESRTASGRGRRPVSGIDAVSPDLDVDEPLAANRDWNLRSRELTADQGQAPAYPDGRPAPAAPPAGGVRYGGGLKRNASPPVVKPAVDQSASGDHRSGPVNGLAAQGEDGVLLSELRKDLGDAEQNKKTGWTSTQTLAFAVEETAAHAGDLGGAGDELKLAKQDGEKDDMPRRLLEGSIRRDGEKAKEQEYGFAWTTESEKRSATGPSASLFSGNEVDKTRLPRTGTRQLAQEAAQQAAQQAEGGRPAGPPATWRAPFTGGDLAAATDFAMQSGEVPIDEMLGLLDASQSAMLDQMQSVMTDGPTVRLDLDGLSRGQALLQTARAGGRQLRPLPDGVEVAGDRRPLDPTGTAGLSRADFQAAFGTVPMASTIADARLTFAFTADTASFDRACAQLRDGQVVEPTDIRAEHFVNAVPSDYPPASGPEAFALYADAGPSPFAAGPLAPRTALVSVGAVARPAGSDERRPLSLTLAIDCSGSMAQPGGLDRVRAGLDQLLERLGPDDSVALVAFGDRARVVLPATPGAERERIAAALAGLQTGGATNAGEGLNLAYQLAAESAKPGRESRVLLATDGATLAGEGAAPVLERIAADRARGISLVVVGCGGRDYQGAALDALAAKGDGQHVYVGSDDEARALFRDKLVPARLGVLARDAKIQVTWNPQRVTHARLVGFETRRLAERDFRDDGVDAGEIAHDTQATALFEVVLAEGGSGPLGSAAVRYLDTRLGAVRELACPLAGSLVKPRPSQRLRLQACSADLADLLGRTWWANQRCATYAGLIAELERCEPSAFRDQLLGMAAQARRLTREP